MRKTILIVAVALCAQWAAAPATHADEGSLVLLLGGPEGDKFGIRLSADGRVYAIQSENAALDVGGSVCWHPEGKPSELNCDATAISGFEVSAGDGDDFVEAGNRVPVPVTLRGEGGNDTLWSAMGSDKLLGGPGNDKLTARGGSDMVIGGPGNDGLFGRPGKDYLSGGSGNDRVNGGPGKDMVFGGPGNDSVVPE